MADLKPSQLATSHSTPADTDIHVVESAGGVVGKQTRAQLLAGVALNYTPPTISGNGAITFAAHGNRVVFVTAAAACTFTASSAAFANGDAVMFVQIGGGALTITGDVDVSPGVASVSTNGDKSVLECIYSSTAGKLLAVRRSAVAVAGGSTVVYDYADHAAAAGASVRETLASLTLPAIAAGARTAIDVHVSCASAGASIELRLAWGGVAIFDVYTLSTGAQSLVIKGEVHHRSATAQLFKPWGNSSFNIPSNSASGVNTVDTSAATTLSVQCTRTDARACTLNAVRVRIE